MNFRREFIAGLTTFLTMAYIIVVNPSILASQGTGMSFSGVMTATVVLAATMSIFMGLYAKLPFAVAPGMGVNAFFTFGIILGQKVPWTIALGMVFWAGVLFLAISLTPLRENLARAIPQHLRIASAGGIGLFLAFIGLKNMGLIVHDDTTLVKLGTIDAKVGISLVGFAVGVVLFAQRKSYAFLVGIGASTLGGVLIGDVHFPEKWVSLPDFKSTFGQMDIRGALTVAALPSVISILFTDLFDSISTFVGVSHATGLKDENGDPKNLREGLIVDAFATFFAAIFGTSSGTAYLESSAGIEAGGRTGLTAVVVGLLFLPFLFISPLAGAVPAYATGPVLVVIGALMFRSVLALRIEKTEEMIPAFLSLILIPLTFSITQGLLWGFVFHVILFIAVGRWREIGRSLWLIFAVSIILLFLGN